MGAHNSNHQRTNRSGRTRNDHPEAIDAARLLQWYDRFGRTLPWRGTSDAYRILVSEFMLQQTQVPRVIPSYHAWMDRFPNWNALANATNADVITAWAGLGYNRRALALRDIARHIAKNGEPKTQEAWLSLKGVGPYTAAALTIFSLRMRALPVDTNIRRVLGRYMHGIPFPTNADDDRIQESHHHLLSGPRFYDIPQALFDLATLICKKTPICDQCPIRERCAARLEHASDLQDGEKRHANRTPREKRHRDKPFPNRIYRGRILSVVRRAEKKLLVSAIGPLVDPSFDPAQDSEWIQSLIDKLVQEGFLENASGQLSLPSS